MFFIGSAEHRRCQVLCTEAISSSTVHGQHDMTSQWQMIISVTMSWYHNHMISTGISMWHLDIFYVLGGLHNHLTHSTTTDKDLKLQTTFPPAGKEFNVGMWHNPGQTLPAAWCFECWWPWLTSPLHSVASHQGSKGRKSQSRFTFAPIFRVDGFSLGGCFFQCDPVVNMPHTLQDCLRACTLS